MGERDPGRLGQRRTSLIAGLGLREGLVRGIWLVTLTLLISCAAGGVAFLSGTLDYYVRAYDVANGKQLWEGRLPAGGQATPMTYLGSDGRQYVLVVAGGHGSLGTKPGDAVIAYALPRS